MRISDWSSDVCSSDLQQNIDRYAETGKVDWLYLQDLSDDAVPVLAPLDDDVVECALDGRSISDDDWLEWNLGRADRKRVVSGKSVSVRVEHGGRLSLKKKKKRQKKS